MHRSWWLALVFVGSWSFVVPTRALAGESQPGITPEPPHPYSPTSSKAPKSKALEAGAEEPAPAPAEPEAKPRPSGSPPRAQAFARHAIGARAGITVVPTWILSRWVDAHTNALCRGETLGNFAREHGLLKTQGCNFYVGGEYIYRQSRVLDIVASLGYQHLHTPDGYWLRNYDPNVIAPGTGSPVAGADYTEIGLGIFYMEADFIARYPIIVRKDVEVGIGGGAGVGLGILFGGVYQTALGANPDGYVPGVGATPDASCQTLRDLADFQRCTPRYDPLEDPDQTPPDPSQRSDAFPYASCTSDECSGRDLRSFGYRQKTGGVPPVIPVVNLILSARVIVKDTVGITISGGFNTGFYFGGSLAYFFGKKP